MPSGWERASAPAAASVSQGNSGSVEETARRATSGAGLWGGVSVLALRRQVLHGLRIVVGLADLGRTAG